MNKERFFLEYISFHGVAPSEIGFALHGINTITS